MSLPNVVIFVNRNGLKQVSFIDDGIFGIVLTGEAVSGKIALLDPKLIYGVDDAIDLGIAETGVNAAAYKQVKEFYDEAGNGTPLYLILSDEDLMSTNVTGTSSAAAKLADYGAGKICMIGIVDGASQGTTIVDGLNNDVLAAATAAQTLATTYEGKLMPLSFIIPGIGYTGDAGAVLDLKTYDKNRVSILLACSSNDEKASVGQLLGRLSSIPVQRKPSRVRSGALTNLAGYLTDGSTIEESLGELGTLHDKGYIVYRTFEPVKSGYFYSGDPTMCADTDDLNSISRNRVIDKVIKLAYKTYIEDLDDDVDVTDQGYLNPGAIGTLKSNIETAVRDAMSGEISNFNAQIEVEQNILSGNPFEIVLDITPKGYLNSIKVTVGFVNPYNA